MAEMKNKSYTKGVALPPRKVKIVADLVRNRTVEDALVILDHTPRRPALVVKKAIESAKANLMNTESVDAKTIYISLISVTAGTRMRRYMPASRGRALPFEKKSSNILVEVAGEEKVKKAAAKPASAKAEVKKPAAKAPAKKPAAKKETK